MNSQWMLHVTLAIAITASLAAPSAAQYQGYPAPSPYSNPEPQRARLPLWDAALPPVTQQPTYNSWSQSAHPRAYNPSQMPSANQATNMQTRQQQMPVSYGGTTFPSTPQYQPAPQNYYMYPASTGNSQQHAVGGGAPYAAPAYSAPAYSAPAPQAAPAPQQHSYYDQPAQNYSPQPNYGLDTKAIGDSHRASSGIGIRSGWYGTGVGIIMNRSRANNIWLSYDQADLRDRVLNSNDANFSSAGGVGASIGHYFNCGRNSIEFVYWGLYPGQSEANAYGADTAAGLETIVHFENLLYDDGSILGARDLSGNFFFNAERHRVQRSYSVHNIELNLLGHNFTSGCGPIQLGWTAGVRYLRFDEDFLYSSDVTNTVFTGAPEEVHYGIDVENNLVGFQFGGQANYCVGSRLSLFTNTKVGLYGNHMTQDSRIYGSNGQAFVNGTILEYAGQDVYANASKNSYSMIGELTVGANWCLSPCWTINAGYRAVGVSGVALATNQVPNEFIALLGGIRNVDSNGSLILHGAFAGLTYCY